MQFGATPGSQAIQASRHWARVAIDIKDRGRIRARLTTPRILPLVLRVREPESTVHVGASGASARRGKQQDATRAGSWRLSFHATTSGPGEPSNEPPISTRRTVPTGGPRKVGPAALSRRVLLR